MKITRFEDLVSWQKSQELAIFIYQTFDSIRDFGYKDQIFRASVSISNNIAEGFDRGSDKEFIRFLTIARGSNSEVKSMIYLAQKLNFISENQTFIALNHCNEIGKLINGLISYLLKSSNNT